MIILDNPFGKRQAQPPASFFRGISGRAVAAGCRLTIDSDAHRTEELAGIRWGVAQARRAWVEPAVVANTWSREALLGWVAGKPGRVP